VKWSEYNESLVRRGEILLGFDVINNWDAELKEMNQGKIGEPFHYPNTFLLLLGYAKAYFHLPYRQTEGITQGHAKGKVPSIPDFTTINRRINRLDIKIKDVDDSMEFKDEYIVIAIDSTGIKVTNRGQWLREKWHIKNNNKKGYLKIHVAVNVKTKKILSMKVTDEHVHDSKALPELIDDVIESDKKITIGKLIADGAYEGNEIFRFLSDKGIQPCIKVRRNARIELKKRNILRNLSVLAQRTDLQKWKDSVSYGKRWIVETVFSSIKRRFGEYVYSVKLKNMIQEMMLKASLYNKLISI
jgi:transposase